MMDAFVALARAGAPNHAGLPAWSGYALPERRTLLFDRVIRVEAYPRRAERELFAPIPYVQSVT